MRKLTITFIIVFILPISIQAQIQSVECRGVVTDAVTNEPISYAHVSILNTKRGCTCDKDGRFTLSLPQGEHEIRFSAMGYQEKRMLIRSQEIQASEIEVSLFTRTIVLTEEVVIANRGPVRDLRSLYDQNMNTIDDLSNKIDGVALIQRANFTSEPSIRGMSSGQVAAVVDGMKIFSACVDHMDPVSAYVEVENLKKLEISKGAFDLRFSQNIGGTINMITEKPDFDKNLFTENEVGYESVSRLKRVRSVVNVSRDDIAMRATFSYKRAGDYYAGRNNRVSRSGFEKNNYKLDFSKKIEAEHQLDISFIGDNAWDIGYPSMLMDTRKTKSQIYSIEHRWERTSSRIRLIESKIYANHIEHWMDDYDRDVISRSVMKDMYMPMFGQTTTVGVTEQALIVDKKQTLRIIGEYYYLDAFADMAMESITKNVSPMYLVNLGSVGVNNISLAVNYDRAVSTRFYWKLNARSDYSNRNVHNKTGRRLLEGTIDTPLHQTYFTAAISSVMEYHFSPAYTMSIALAQSERMPTHLENYGFYLYNIQDGYFYMGNPNLKPEQSRQIEWRLNSQHTASQYQLSVFYNTTSNYVIGVLTDSEFKTYINTDRARIAGAECSGTLNLSARWSIAASASYLYGENDELNEPLPLIAPLQGSAAIVYQKEKIWLGLDARLAAAQKRIASKTTLEDKTNGFAVLNIRGSVKWNSHFEWKFGVENIFDKLYHEHLSVNNLPGRGRNIYAGIIVTY
ncbi:TonB-dependent receptor [bacterium]|nr:MAG: TonB-dependent receptor [bacterium]